jgi:hypothetical protein
MQHLHACRRRDDRHDHQKQHQPEEDKDRIRQRIAGALDPAEHTFLSRCTTLTR